MFSTEAFAVSNNDSENKESQELIRKLLRTLQDLAKRIEEHVHRACAVADLFNADLGVLRLRLRDYSIKLLHTDPIQYGLKAVDFYWRKGFHETVSRAKQLKKGINWTSNEKAYLHSHLMNGIGHFHHLIMILGEYDFTTEIQIDFCGLHFYGNNIPSARKRSLRADRDRTTTCFIQILHKCLMCLGDLSRYQLEFAPATGLSIPQRYYHQALLLDPSNGVPFNQLAALARNDNDNIDATFFYLRCLACSQQFDGAESNVKRVLETNRLVFEQIDVDTTTLNILEPDEETRRCNVYTLHMVNSVLFADAEKGISKLCQKTLQSVQNCLYAPMDRSNTDGTSWTKIILEEDAATKMVGVLLVAMEILKRNGEETKLSMIRAYILALFSHFITRIMSDLSFNLFGPEAAVDLFQEKLPEEPKKEVAKADGDKKKKRSRLDQLRRRVRNIEGSSAGDSDSSDDDLLDGDADGSDSDDDLFVAILDPSDSEYSETDDDDDDVIVEEVSDILTTLDLVSAVTQHQLIEPARLCFLWLMGSKDLIKTAGANSAILWDRLAKLFNILSFDNPKYQSCDQVSNAINSCLGKFDQFPFPEDFLTRGMTSLLPQQESIVWEHQESLDNLQKGIMRILQFSRFRDWLCHVPETGLSMDGAVVVVGVPAEDRADDKSSDSSEKENRENKENNAEEKTKKTATMMQNMAQLWLQQEVKDLEGKSSVRGSFQGMAQYSPYIVVDHLAFTRHLQLVKDIVASRKFAVIVPTAVVQELDGLKKTNGGARNAIRWLEKKFQEGNRWLRPQKKTESKPLDMITYPKKKNKDAWQYFKILECCNYFAHARSGQSTSKTVTLLTADEENGKSGRPAGVAESIDVRVENVDGFHKKTRTKQKKSNNG